ncbi:glycerol-3-phosphate 1-O-acyltransferase PlsY [Guyparkeria sp. 1SP6A2]|nr:glycerol-3-phosphate 1-O-acyltransferase PlsY [Guyparkeria sp. 1SP6A2]
MTALDWPLLLIVAVAAYLVGSLSTAVITARLLGLPDPRSAGSGNPGATNVLRLGGKKAAIVTLVGDLLKGLLPVLVARVAVDAPMQMAAMGTAGLFAFLGHLYPVFFGFKGGKGVATAAGAILGMAPLIGLIAIVGWASTAAATRYSSLSALFAAVVAATLATFLSPPPIALAISVMALLLIIRHHGNIRRLARGEEPRIGAKDKQADDE